MRDASLFTQHPVTRQGQVADRFTRAVDQLGSGKLEVRLGGIYGLERIARESPDSRLVVTEVLSAYVRQRAPGTPRPQSCVHRSTSCARGRLTFRPS